MSEQKIVINKCFGGFGLSRAAFHRLRELGSEHAKDEADIGESWKDGGGPRPAYLDSFCGEIPRDDLLLVRVVEELGDAASAPHATLRVVTVPVGVQWEIDDYDGMESIHEAHRSWG